MTYTSKSEGTKTPRGEAALDSRRPARVSTLARQHASGQMRRLLQQTLGNQGVLRRMESGLRINDVNDPAEKEADRVAAAVMAAPSAAANPITVTKSPAAAVQRKCASCAEEDARDLTVQRKESTQDQPTTGPAILNQAFNSAGHPLDQGTLAFMQNRFGRDLSDVRVHTDGQAADSAKAIEAQAYTFGRDIFFGAAKYQPQMRAGKALLAHELAHTLQNAGGERAQAIQRKSEEDYIREQRFRQPPTQPTATRVDAAIELVRRALVYATNLPPEKDRALGILLRAETFLRPFVGELSIEKYYKGGLERTNVQIVAGGGVGAVRTIQGQIRSGVGRSSGLWDYYFDQVRAARNFLVVLSGEAPASPSLDLNYDELKEAFYQGLISGLKQAQGAVIQGLRSAATKLPQNWQPAANSLINVVSFVLDLFVALILAIVGLVVGFVEGIVTMIVGIAKLAIGIVKLLADAIMGVFDNFEMFRADIDAIVNGFMNIRSGLRIIVGDWLARYKKASLERQVLMGSELVGQVEALLFSFSFTAAKAGQLPKLTIPTQLEVRTLVQASATGLPETQTVVVVTGTRTVSAAAPVAAGALAAPALLSAAVAGGGGPGGGGGSGGGSSPPVPGGNITEPGSLTEAAFKESSKTEARLYIYELVDAEGNHLKWGTASNPYTRFNGYVGEGLGGARMRVYPPQPRYQALATETRGLQSELEQGRGGLNVRTETRAEMRHGADWTEILDQPDVPSRPLITIRR